MTSSVIPKFTDKVRSILLFGPPGAGKGTVGAVLAQAGQHYHLSSGDIFRSLSPMSPAGKLAAQYSGQGLLVPDEVTIEIWYNYVQGLVASNKYFPEQQYLLLDGIPRTLAQAKALDQYVDIQAIIVLDTDDKSALVDRLKRRAALEGRADDVDETVLAKRMDVYDTQTAEVLGHYDSSIIHRFNAAQGRYHILKDVFAKLADELTFIPL